MVADLIQPVASSSRGNCFLVGGELLLDAGVTVSRLRGAIGFQVAQIQAVLVSHSHSDHAKGVAGLLKLGVTCAMSEATATALGVTEHHRVRLVKPGVHYAFGRWQVECFAVEHDVPTLGFLVSDDHARLLYLTDTASVPSMPYYLPFTHVLIEANHRASELAWRFEAGEGHATRVLNSHMSLEGAIEALQRLPLSAGCQVWLTHMSASHGDAEGFLAEAQAALPHALVKVAPE